MLDLKIEDVVLWLNVMIRGSLFFIMKLVRVVFLNLFLKWIIVFVCFFNKISDGVFFRLNFVVIFLLLVM